MNAHLLVIRLLACWLFFVLPGLNATAMQYSDHDLSTYEQTLTITFRNAEATQKAIAGFSPLLNDHHRAVSCRWDDNWTSDNPATRDLMEEYGIRGTWYLNARNFSPDSNRYGDYAPVAEKLLNGGNSIGGHSLTHPYLTYYHHNRMFAEVAGVRIEWEAALNRPVHSYAYSFVDLRPEPEGRHVLQRSLSTLERAGYLHIAEYLNFVEDLDLPLEFSPIMPPENNTYEVFEQAIDWAYHDQMLTRQYPMITNSMHAWYGTPRLNYSYDELRKRLEKLKNLPDVWHCNQNQFAAYRRQHRQTTSQVLERHEKTLRLGIRRPKIDFLGDEIPLTLKISNVAAADIEHVQCDGRRLLPTDSDTAAGLLFNVPHSTSQQLPTRISHYPNPDNSANHCAASDDDFPDIDGFLHVVEGNLRLHLTWSAQQKMDQVRITWRTPLGWEVDQIHQAIADLPEDSHLSLAQAIRPSEVPDSRWGKTQFVAQVDFLLNNQPGRIYLTTQRNGEPVDASLPANGFSILGPIPNEDWDTQQFLEHLQFDEDKAWITKTGNSYSWRLKANDGYIQRSWMNPEYVVTMGTWDTVAPTYVLRSKVHSEKSQTVKLLTSHSSLRTVILNGEVIEGDSVELRNGENRLFIIYPGCSLDATTQRLAACFVRFADPETGQRIQNIRYVRY